MGGDGVPAVVVASIQLGHHVGRLILRHPVDLLGPLHNEAEGLLVAGSLQADQVAVGGRGRSDVEGCQGQNGEKELVHRNSPCFVARYCMLYIIADIKFLSTPFQEFSLIRLAELRFRASDVLYVLLPDYRKIGFLVVRLLPTLRNSATPLSGRRPNYHRRHYRAARVRWR